MLKSQTVDPETAHPAPSSSFKKVECDEAIPSGLLSQFWQLFFFPETKLSPCKDVLFVLTHHTTQSQWLWSSPAS